MLSNFILETYLTVPLSLYAIKFYDAPYLYLMYLYIHYFIIIIIFVVEKINFVNNLYKVFKCKIIAQFFLFCFTKAHFH